MVSQSEVASGESMSARRHDHKRSPQNIDDIPIGGGHGSATKDYSRSSRNDNGSGRKIANVEAIDYGDDDMGNQYDNNNDLLPDGDRAIRPKQKLNYDDPDPVIGEVEGSNNIQEEKFARGHHPLEGVENLADLPSPEALTGKSK